MAFEMQHKDDIQQRMKADFRRLSDYADYEGSFSRDVINANSVEFENVYAEMSLMMEASFASTAWGDYLTARCAEFGVDRKAAVRAKGAVTFTGTQGTIVPAGSIVAVKGGVQFTTDEAVTLDGGGKGTVKVTCSETGMRGNVQAHTITAVPISIAGVTGVDNDDATQDGAEEETDADLFKRYSVIVRTPATSGNKYHYYNWAMSIAGVGACRVVPLWNGAGTVKVIVVNAQMQPAGSDLIQTVADYIESVRPIGADVTVTTLIPKTFNITVDIVGIEDKARLKEAVNHFIASKHIEMHYISAAQVGKILMEQNVVDYRNLRLNGAEIVTATNEELLSVGDITLHVFPSFE